MSALSHRQLAPRLLVGVSGRSCATSYGGRAGGVAGHGVLDCFAVLGGPGGGRSGTVCPPRGVTGPGGWVWWLGGGPCGEGVALGPGLVTSDWWGVPDRTQVWGVAMDLTGGSGWLVWGGAHDCWPPSRAWVVPSTLPLPFVTLGAVVSRGPSGGGGGSGSLRGLLSRCGREGHPDLGPSWTHPFFFFSSLFLGKSLGLSPPCCLAGFRKGAGPVQRPGPWWASSTSSPYTHG